MKILSKDTQAQLAELIARLEEREGDVESAISRLNAAIEDARSEVEAAVNDYNEVVREAGEIREQAVSDVQEYFDERSEKWQDGEKGQEYVRWIDNLTDLDLSEIEVELPGQVEEPDFAARMELEQNWQNEP